MPTDVCRRVPLHRLALDAQWQLDDVNETGGSPLDLGAYLVADCALNGRTNPTGGGAPLDGGSLNLEINTASGAAGVEIIRSAPGLRSAYEGAFAARGLYDSTEVTAAGWWSEGSIRVYQQDASGDSLRITRVTVSGQITDGNLTASVLVSAQVLADDPARVKRLETLAIETLRALEGALEPNEDVVESEVSR